MAHATKPERNPLVLVVDDEPLMLPLIARILRENGYEVHGAAHGLAAKQILTSGMVAPDLVLTDLRMPHLDGLQLGRAVAELLPSVPVAYMSAYDAALSELPPRCCGITSSRSPSPPPHCSPWCGGASGGRCAEL